VWSTVQFALNGIVFVLLGEQMPGILQAAIASVEQSGHLNPWWLLVYALAINVCLAVLRFSWVWVSLWLPRVWARRRGQSVEKPHWRLIMATTLAGVRGAITLAGVLSLPLLMPDNTVFPARELVVFLAASVILMTLLAASIALPPLLKGLKLPAEPALQREEDHARHAAATKAIAAIEKAQHELVEHAAAADVAVYTQAAARLTGHYQRRLGGDAISDREAGQLRKADQAEGALRLAALQAEREEVFNLARHFRISDETSRKLVRELDLMEARYR
jgi:NhaP-type Na+/H+ or K+/H+ antiporter